MKQHLKKCLTTTFVVLFLFVAIGSTYDTFDDFNCATSISATDLDDNIGHPGDGLGFAIPQFSQKQIRTVLCEVQTFHPEACVVTCMLPSSDNISRAPPTHLS